MLRLPDERPLPPAAALDSTPSLEVEWHYSVRELCALMARVADLPLMSINSGGADATAFAHIAFKGGSDVGATNLTTQVTTRRGSEICFSATINDPCNALDSWAFATAYQSVIGALADR